MMKRYYQGLANDLLNEEIATLTRQLSDAEEVLAARTGKETFRCCECGKTDEDEETIYNHLLDDHNYPDEDAGLSVERIYA